MEGGEPIVSTDGRGDGRVLHNTDVTWTTDGTWITDGTTRDPLEFHRKLPGYAPTRLVHAELIASELGVGAVLVKDESDRFGLPSFKILGSSWACYRAISERLGGERLSWSTIDDLARRCRELRPLTFVAATDGNHGRAVAWMARMLGLDARIFVPAGTAAVRIEAIESEGAVVEVVEGSYDEAVATAAGEASERCLVVSDTSWPGYERIPRWVIEGYTTIFWEIEDAIGAARGAGPAALVIPIGVGALATAAVLWARSTRLRRPMLIGVEPAEVPSMTSSVEAGRPVTLPGPHRTIMSGLRCGTPSMIAFPLVRTGVEWFVTVEDHRVASAMNLLAGSGIVSGETGAAALAGLREILASPDAQALRDDLVPLAESTIVVLSTEGATDPDSYRQLVDRPRSS